MKTTEITTNPADPTPGVQQRSPWNRRTRIMALSAALIGTVHFCHPPTLDVNIFHRDNGGQQAVVAE
jgi:hypothetical protein